MSGSAGKNPKSVSKASWKREYDATFGEDKISTLVKRAKVALSYSDLGTFHEKLKDALVVYIAAKEDDEQSSRPLSAWRDFTRIRCCSGRFRSGPHRRAKQRARLVSSPDR